MNLESILPERPRCLGQSWFTTYFKDQILGMIYAERLEPLEYQIIDRVQLECNGEKFYSTLKIKDNEGWFYVETLENADNNVHTRSDSTSDLVPEKMEPDRVEEPQNSNVFDTRISRNGGKPQLVQSPASQIPAVSDNLTLPEIDEKQEDIQIYNNAQKYALNSKAKNTIDGYKKDFRRFHNFCVRKSFESLPAQPETVIAYITWMADNKKTATIKRHLAAIKFVHENAHKVSPITKDVKNILDGIKRTNGDRSESKKPLLAEHIRKICSDLSPTDLIDIRDKALLLINYSGCFRRSELVSLDVKDVHLIDGKGIEITLKHSKTDQYGHGTTKAIPYGENDLTCPVLALRHWLISAAIMDGAIFRGFDINGNLMNERLTDRSVANIIKKLVESIGLNPEEYSAHSTRSGAATQAALNHSSLKKIMDLGDWKTPNMAIRYQKSINKFEEKADLGL